MIKRILILLLSGFTVLFLIFLFTYQGDKGSTASSPTAENKAHFLNKDTGKEWVEANQDDRFVTAKLFVSVSKVGTSGQKSDMEIDLLAVEMEKCISKTFESESLQSQSVAEIGGLCSVMLKMN